MTRDPYEPNRFLGFPISRDPQARQRDPRARQDEEPQRVMGIPVDWFDTLDNDWLQPLAHPVREYRKWLRRRRLGPYATDEDEPGRPG
jgi:hypothetical protein